jgi:protoporphyrinogen IX oxidase
MQWLVAFHIIAMTAWFAGLFYLPRLFVYHADCQDSAGDSRFKIMEYKLYYYIMTPAAILTTVFGIALFWLNWGYYLHQSWMIIKLAAVFILWGYHHACGRLVKIFKSNQNKYSEQFYRWFNEVPTVLLIVIVIMVVVKP